MSSVSNSDVLQFAQAGRVPAAGDNVAIAIRNLPAGTVLQLEDRSVILPFTILEGHRFAVRAIAKGEPLLSWGLPFGFALHLIRPGDYICNEKILRALSGRHVPFALPGQPNFLDYRIPYSLHPETFRPGAQVPLHANPGNFQGYWRGPARGAGTRNYVVILGTTSWTSSFARNLAAQFESQKGQIPNVDGVVAIGHTEGGSLNKGNNHELLLRTLSGFLMNPNVGAVLAVDIGNEGLNNSALLQYAQQHDYPIAEVPLQFLSVGTDFEKAFRTGASCVQSLIAQAARFQRSAVLLCHLNIGLQCGGSDAFSGVSGNPLAGLITKELVRNGGMANLAETDELIGAEPYILSNVRDLSTAQGFVNKLKRFQEWAGWHGHSAEGNPSGGNNYRGLYNIAIKSIGAALKKDPEVRLDYVIDYGERMGASGFYFMDSPGNDLESIAGQVASGCNLIVFTTGNGSITNFPFVPTIKIMTTSARYKMLAREMDFNAGRYQDGESLLDLGKEAFELAVRVASGELTAGEKAGHSQVQLWRDWKQTGPAAANSNESEPMLDGSCPVHLLPGNAAEPGHRFLSSLVQSVATTPSYGLIVPTSLCAGEIGKQIALKLNRESIEGYRNFAALAHTEGCGNSAGLGETLAMRLLSSYLLHPSVSAGLLLEHGCEKTHNDAFRNFMAEAGVELDNFGWASIQMDGGIEKVTQKATNWFIEKAHSARKQQTQNPGSIRLAIISPSLPPLPILLAYAMVIRSIVESGGMVVIPENSLLLRDAAFLEALGVAGPLNATLNFGRHCGHAGLQIMESQTDHWIETVSGLGAAGVQCFVAWTNGTFMQGHVFIPLIQLAARTNECESSPDNRADLSLDLSKSPMAIATETVQAIIGAVNAEVIPLATRLHNQDFQITRGNWGVSL